MAQFDFTVIAAIPENQLQTKLNTLKTGGGVGSVPLQLISVVFNVATSTYTIIAEQVVNVYPGPKVVSQ